MKEIAGTTAVAGIIGWPVSQSLSPAIHNAAFASAGLDWVYVAFPVPPGEAGRAVDAMRSLGLRGLSVTMPHKRDVIETLDRLSPEAERAQSVNTIVRDGDLLIGENTDGRGFLRFLERDAGMTPGNVRALVLGAGGAASAVAIALSDAGAEVVVAARRQEQAEALAMSAKDVRTVGFEPGALAREAAGAGLIVNATPVGRDGEATPLDPAGIGDRHVLVDLIYHPETTPLVRSARDRGAVAFNGLGMLVHQAALSYELWTGRPAPLEAMRAAVS